MMGLMLCLALAPEEGLLLWSTQAFGFGPKSLHVFCGALVALTLAWLLGSRKVWKGLLGIALAVAAGGAGEMAQLVLTAGRNARVSDFLITALGCASAAVPYLLAMGARLCESEEAKPRPSIEEGM